MVPPRSSLRNVAGLIWCAKMQTVRLADRPAGPGPVLLHDHEAADRPVVLPVARVVEVGAPKVRADHHYHPVSDTVLLGVVPQVVD